MQFEIFSISFTSTDALLLVATGIVSGVIGTMLGVLLFGRNYKQRIAALEAKLEMTAKPKKVVEPEAVDIAYDRDREKYTLKRMISEINGDINKICSWYFGLMNFENPVGLIFFLMTIPFVFFFGMAIIFTPILLFLGVNDGGG